MAARVHGVAIPDFQSLMRPILNELRDGQPKAIANVRSTLAREFGLTDEELVEELPSGRAKTFPNRVCWATTYLHRTGLLSRPRRSVYQITQRGQDVLSTHPDRVDLRVLAQFPELGEFRGRHPAGENQPLAPAAPSLLSLAPDVEVETTPQERIAAAYRELRTALIAEILDSVGDEDPDFFERLVLDVLQAIGYGGAREDAAQRLGQSGDGGVDGVIREDRLGLDQIYVQAKRWSNPVGRPEIQRFFGALHG